MTHLIQAPGGLKVPVYPSDPTFPENGTMWYNATAQEFRGCADGTITTIAPSQADALEKSLTPSPITIMSTIGFSSKSVSNITIVDFLKIDHLNGYLAYGNSSVKKSVFLDSNNDISDTTHDGASGNIRTGAYSPLLELVVLGGNNGTIVRSSDLETWDNAASVQSGGAHINKIMWVGGTINKFVARAGDVLMSSDDGSTWVSDNPDPGEFPVGDFDYHEAAGNFFVHIDQKIWYTSNFSSWNSFDLPTPITDFGFDFGTPVVSVVPGGFSSGTHWLTVYFSAPAETRHTLYRRSAANPTLTGWASTRMDTTGVGTIRGFLKDRESGTIYVKQNSDSRFYYTKPFEQAGGNIALYSSTYAQPGNIVAYIDFDNQNKCITAASETIRYSDVNPANNMTYVVDDVMYTSKMESLSNDGSPALGGNLDTRSYGIASSASTNGLKIQHYMSFSNFSSNPLTDTYDTTLGVPSFDPSIDSYVQVNMTLHNSTTGKSEALTIYASLSDGVISNTSIGTSGDELPWEYEWQLESGRYFLVMRRTAAENIRARGIITRFQKAP